jgi:uncharacterized protein (TIGR04255 family)
MRDNLVNVDHFQRRAFKKHFLNSVHCELGLSGIVASSILAKEASFNEAFKKLGFTEGGKVVSGHYVLASPEAQDATLQHNAEAVGLRFVSQKPRREINITSHNIAVSDNSYDGYEAFSERLQCYVSIVTELLGSGWSINKTGLRKINSIIIEQVQSYSEACAIFNPVLFGSLRSGLAHSGSLKISEEVLILEEQGKLCVLRNGLKALDHPNAYEAILDFDLVDQSKYTTEQVFTDVLPILNELHFDLFMWAITDEMLQSMEDDKV